MQPPFGADFIIDLCTRRGEEKAAAGYVRKKITSGSDLTSRVPAYLLIPNNVKRGATAMLCLHDDTPLGKDEPAGLAGRV